MKKKEFTFHNIIWYMILFSILGLLIETIYGYVSTGVLESRKGLILGPFCPVYGIGAAFFIVLLSEYKESKVKLFIMGAIAGTIFEYICSYMLQVIYGSMFWDYSYTTYQINGRVSLTYTVFWGILAVLLVKYLKPQMDKIINKIPSKFWDKIITAFLILDIALTILGVTVYMNRAEKRYNEEEINETVLDKIFNDNLMSFIFPNLRFTDEVGNSIMVRDILNEGIHS